MSSRECKGTDNYKGFRGLTRNAQSRSQALLSGFLNSPNSAFANYNIAVRPELTIRSRCRSFKIAMIVWGISLFIALPATAQRFTPDDSSLANSEASKPTLAALPSESTSPRPHAFWDRTNVALFSGIAITRGMDYASTRNFEARGRQEILLPEDVVHNSAAFASLEAAATVTSVGLSYLLHRTGHHKLERWMSIGHINVTAFGDVRNYALESRHP